MSAPTCASALAARLGTHRVLTHAKTAPRHPPRAPGVELRKCAEAQWCCGSAGIHNITQPETAARLQERKTNHVLATGASTVATANPGCRLQFENGLRVAFAERAAAATSSSLDLRLSTSVTPPTVTHPIILLATAYRAETSPS